MSILSEKSQGCQIFKQRSVTVEKKQIEYAVVYEIVFARSLFVGKGGRDIA